MNVMSLMRQANPDEVARIYNEAYNSETKNDGWGNSERFTEFVNRLESEVGIRGGEDQFKVSVTWIDYKWGGKDNEKYHDQYYSVGGHKVNDPKMTWSLSMTDWGEWKEMEVEDKTDHNLSINDLAAHIYYEMTWYGWPETMVNKRGDILDSFDKFTRDFEGYKEGDPLPEGYMDMGEWLKENKNE